jgi:hypothetical protein
MTEVVVVIGAGSIGQAIGPSGRRTAEAPMLQPDQVTDPLHAWRVPVALPSRRGGERCKGGERRHCSRRIAPSGRRRI